VTARTAAEIGAFLARSGLLGATFVACPTAPGAGRLRWIALAAGAVLFFLACLGATTYALASEPPPKPVAPAPRAPASSGTAPAPLQQGTK
jgi:hypothetical protein